MKKQNAKFPFHLIMSWTRPITEGECRFCKKSATFHMFQFINYPFPSPENKLGLYILNPDKAWSESIEKQMRGDYTNATCQPACRECMFRFTSIQLGHETEMHQLLSLAGIAKEKYSITLSQIVGCTVHSVTDVGDTWAMNVYDTTLEDVIKQVHSTPTPQPQNDEE